MKKWLFCSLPLVGVWLLASLAWSQTASPDSSTAVADSLREGGTALVADASEVQLPPGEDAAFLVSWTRETKGSISAEVRKVGYSGSLSSNMTLAQGAQVTQQAGISTEDYRKQDKTVDRRDGSVLFSSGQSLPFTTSLRLSETWSEDRTATTDGRSNLNKRDFKQAALNMSKKDVQTGAFKHGFYLNGAFNDQKGQSQQQRNDFSEGSLSGAIRSSFQATEGLVVATSLYGQKTQGDRSLGGSTSSSSADRDSLSGGIFFGRGRWKTSFTIKRANFNKRYLDYRRNANGLVDTVGLSEVEKIVEELEQKDAISMRFDHRMQLGKLSLKTNLSRVLDEDSYRISNAGRKEREQDQFDVDLSYRYSDTDSMIVKYGYLWKWDDQQIRGATQSRGRQIQRRRDVGLRVLHKLFTNTNLTFDYNVGLSQDIAQGQFNENDRDRFETNAKIQLNSNWQQKFRTNMTLAYRHVEDISIRRSRSANNNEKDSYELTPGYVWPIAPWLDLQQNFRISIQFTDFVFSDLSSVRKEDDYNKRGNLNTKVILRPSSRLTCTISHDYNAKFNATQARSDAVGTDFYRRDLEQRISRIDLTLRYEATDWLKLEGASYRSKDLKDSFGDRITSTDKRSGELWLGGSVNKSFGSQNRPLTLAAAMRRYQAFGPNVQESNAKYWDADVSLSWKF